MLTVMPDFAARAEKQNYKVFDSTGALPPENRVMAIVDGRFELAPVMQKVIDILARNKKGYFLMVEWDAPPINQRPASTASWNSTKPSGKPPDART